MKGYHGRGGKAAACPICKSEDLRVRSPLYHEPGVLKDREGVISNDVWCLESEHAPRRTEELPSDEWAVCEDCDWTGYVWQLTHLPDWTPCEDGCPGWLVGGHLPANPDVLLEISRCDACERFDDDREAQRYVLKALAFEPAARLEGVILDARLAEKNARRDAHVEEST